MKKSVLLIMLMTILGQAFGYKVMLHNDTDYPIYYKVFAAEGIFGIFKECHIAKDGSIDPHHHKEVNVIDVIDPEVGSISCCLDRIQVKAFAFHSPHNSAEEKLPIMYCWNITRHVKIKNNALVIE
jgi:hypothetical protein